MLLRSSSSSCCCGGGEGALPSGPTRPRGERGGGNERSEPQASVCVCVCCVWWCLVGGSRVDWLARCVGVGYGARGIEARLRCCAFGAVVLPEKKPGNHLTDGGGGTERNGDGGGGDRGGGAAQGRHPYIDACRRRGGLDFTLLRLCACRCPPPAASHTWWGARGFGCAVRCRAAPAFFFPFLFPFSSARLV